MIQRRHARRSVSSRLEGTPWREVMRAADRKRDAFAKLYLLSVQQAKDALDVYGLEQALLHRSEAEAMQVAGYAFGAMAVLLSARLPKMLFETMAAGGEAAARHARNRRGFRLAVIWDESMWGDLHFDLVNPRSVRWAYERAGTLITGINAESRASFLAAVRDIIASAFTEGHTVAEVARLLREHLGLTDRYAAAITRLRLEMLEHPGGKIWAGKVGIRVPKTGADWSLLIRRGIEYARRLLNFRARMIARTETLAAANMGQIQLWEQAKSAGFLRGDEYKVWITTPDERLCSECEQLEGEEVPFDSEFSSGDMAPPLHPMCRCTVGLTKGPWVQSLAHRVADFALTKTAREEAILAVS